MALSRTLERVGLVLGGRYRLLAPIGTGASASVYVADDVTLRRRVAVKVLHEALAHDEAFLRRFQAEAQSAAALNHPHVMAVYDWGDTGEWPYLVMEHLAGGSVRAVLDTSGPLSLSQALIVGLETARGLDYAHRRGFVHRDIKPANLLFDEEGRLRIADFGLARALAEAAWTEPMGAVLGTARYASPEQAKGESLDGRSDVYSLALVLIEAVTGTVPFHADTTIGTLMARVDKPVPVPPELGPLRPILEAAGRPDPAERVDAAQFGAALLAAAERLDRPRPIPLPGSVLLAGEVPDPDPTTISGGSDGAEPTDGPDAGVLVTVADLDAAADDPARGIVVPQLDGDITGIVDLRTLAAAEGTDLPDADWPARSQGPDLGHDGHDGHDDEIGPFNWQDDSELGVRSRRKRRRDGRAVDQAGAATTAMAVDADADRRTEVVVTNRGWFDDGEDLSDHGVHRGAGAVPYVSPHHEEAEPRRRGRWGRRVAVTLLVLALLGGGGFAGWWYGIRIPSHAVPAYVGQGEAAAQRSLSSNGWRVERTTAFDDDAGAGVVLQQSPAPGTELEEQQIVRLTVSLGPPPVAVPTNLVGGTLDDAGRALARVSLKVGEVTRAFDEDAAVDTVLALAPGTPTEVTKGGAVGLTVSKGPEPRTIPGDLIGGGADAASAALSALGLSPDIEEQFSETVNKGVVMAVDPAPGEKADKGSPVTLVVSKGPQLIAVPSVRGLTVVEAADKIEAAGLVVEGTQGSPRRVATGTNPAAGTMVRKGTAVTISTSGATNEDDD